ncbi:MAG: GAF domain-containing protein [Thermodesulfobacteriota bacterium]
MAKKPTYDELEQKVRDLQKEAARHKMVESALQKSTRRLATLIDFVPYPIEVLTIDGRVYYLNQAFTKMFGWTLNEMDGKFIPFVPPECKQETADNFRRLLKEKVLKRHETKRLTKDNRILDVAVRAVCHPEYDGEPPLELVIFRDITQEKRIARINEALLRISMALPAYPDLEDILDYISSEIKLLLNVDGAIVILLDEEKNDLFFLGTAYEDRATQKRAKEIRFPADKGVAGKVIKTGEPVIVPDTSKDPDFYSVVDKQLGYGTHDMLDVPLRSSDRIVGVLCATNKKEGVFDTKDVDLLSMIGGTVALSVENARVSDELKKAYQEVTSLNRAKDNVINHLSHELKTPVAVLASSLNILTKKLAPLPKETWGPSIERAQRNLDRIKEIEYEVEDIMRDKQHKTYGLLSLILDQYIDELESLITEEGGEFAIVENVRKRIEEIFKPKDIVSEKILLNEYIKERLEYLKPFFSHRDVEIVSTFVPVPFICMPSDPLQKVIDGLIKNAIENTPDEGKIEIIVQKKGKGAEFAVHDYGVGIIEEAQRRIFEGFFATQDEMAYSSKRPYDFNAGGKGADLLRMKIFSERYSFKIDMVSSRCCFIPKKSDICPGRISKCAFCENKEDCYHSGGTIFYLYFPPAPKKDCSARAGG